MYPKKPTKNLTFLGIQTEGQKEGPPASRNDGMNASMKMTCCGSEVTADELMVEGFEDWMTYFWSEVKGKLVRLKRIGTEDVGGVFKYVLFSPLFVKKSNLTSIFQIGLVQPPTRRCR